MKKLLLGLTVLLSVYGHIEDYYQPMFMKGPCKAPKNIDFLYVINLNQRVERWKTSFDRLQFYGLFPQRFPAIYGWGLSAQDLHEIGLVCERGMWTGAEPVKYFPPTGEDDYLVWLNEERRGNPFFSLWMTKGAIGCLLSHLSVLKDAYDSGYETIWILEDDFTIVNDPHQISSIIEELDAAIGPKNWDLIFTDPDHLHFNPDCDWREQVPMMWRPDMPYLDRDFLAKEEDVSEHVLQIQNRMRTTSMIFRRSGIKKILDFYHDHQSFLPYDHELSFIPGLQMFVVKYDLITAGNTSSDTHWRNF